MRVMQVTLFAWDPLGPGRLRADGAHLRPSHHAASSGSQSAENRGLGSEELLPPAIVPGAPTIAVKERATLRDVTLQGGEAQTR